MADETTPSPAETLNSKISSLQSKLNNVRSEALLTRPKDELENLSTTISNLPSRIAKARSDGHVFDVGLEQKATDLQNGWPAVRQNALDEVNRHANLLQSELQSVEFQVRDVVNAQSNPDYGLTLAAQAENALSSFDSKVDSIVRSISGVYDSFESQVSTLNTRLAQIEEMFKKLTAASFQLMPSEGLVAAVPAKLDKDGKEDPKGFLFLTDQRILFEQNEEVATKKVLFIATEKQKVQKLLVEQAVGTVEKVTASKKGMLGNEDHLDVMFESGSATRAAHFHINGQDCNLWQTMINRAKTKDFDKERAVKVDTAVDAKLSTAPTKCSSCSANFTKPVMRGQTEIKCEYCGAVTRW